MKPVNFPEQNYTFGPPPGVSENDCGNLPCYKGIEDETRWPVIISAWAPSPEELAEINRTRQVWLRVYSTGMFPISLSGISPWPKCSTPPLALDDQLQHISELYEDGKDCLHSMSVLADEMQHRDRLYEVLRELRDVAATLTRTAHENRA